MLEPLMYLVSAVLKLWHTVLLFFGFNTQTAWLLSIFLLLITVRALLVPLQVKTLLNGRKLILARPVIANAKAKHGGDKMNADQARDFREVQRSIHKDHGYSTATGCFMPLLQMPVFIGLFRVLTAMARPQEGLGAAHHGVGVLSGQDVDEFLQVTISGIPLPAYVAMSPEQFEMFGTDKKSVLDFVLPFLVLATILSVTSIVASINRTSRTLEYSNKVAVRMIRIMRYFVFAGFFLLFFGLTGPAPVALVLYWCASNGWTLLQSIGIEAWLNWKYPLTDAFFYMQAQEKEAYLKQAAEEHQAKQIKKRRKWAMRFQPWKRQEIKAAMAADAAVAKEKADQRAAEKEQLKKINAHLNAIHTRKQRIVREAKKVAKAAEEEGLGINPHVLAAWAIRWGAADIAEDEKEYCAEAVDIAQPLDIPKTLLARAEKEIAESGIKLPEADSPEPSDEPAPAAAPLGSS